MNDVLALALNLSEPERAALAHELLSSLSHPASEVADDREWEATCMAEVERRAIGYERGETKARAWREALQDIHERLPRNPANGASNPSGS